MASKPSSSIQSNPTKDPSISPKNKGKKKALSTIPRGAYDNFDESMTVESISVSTKESSNTSSIGKQQTSSLFSQRQKSIKERLDEIASMDPEEKKHQVNQWMKTKGKEIKQSYKKQREERKEKNRELRMQYREKLEAYDTWKVKKEEEAKLQEEEKRRQEELERLETEERIKIQEASANLYRKWLNIKKEADFERRQEEKIKALNFQAQQSKNTQLGEKAIKEWLNEAKRNPTAASTSTAISKTKTI